MIPPRVLIAGNGDLGSRIADRLRATGASVRSIVRRPRPNNSDLIALDLTQPVLGALPDAFDLLLHCVAPSVRDELSYRAVYIDALRHLLDAVPSARRLVFVSSTAVYGDHGGARIDESAACCPRDFNGRVLLEAEALAQSCGRDALVLRLGGIYGPGREMLLKRVRSGVPLLISEQPLYTNRIHVEDAAAAAAHLITRAASGVFNLVDDANTAQSEVLDWLADRLHLPRLERSNAPLPAENKQVDNARLHATGFHFTYPDFRAGYDALLR